MGIEKELADLKIKYSGRMQELQTLSEDNERLYKKVREMQNTIEEMLEDRIKSLKEPRL